MFRLRCAVQNYEWGKFGMESEVAKLLQSAQPDLKVTSIPYAELWMGTHPSGPSIIDKENKSLADWIQENPDSLGDTVIAKFGPQLPFLFKVLSVNKALSIQAHPNKSHAEQLHKERPDLYKDPNHKPEMAIALTPFEALCGFRQPGEIVKFLKDIPELRSVVGDQNATKLEANVSSDCKPALKNCFHSLMTCSDETVKRQLLKLVDRFKSQGSSHYLSDLFLRIHSEFPGDVGCFCIYFLNYLELQQGEAMFLGPNEPHAYLYGDCIECMACSDNVVRAGLTPKYKDVETLCEMLTYETGTAQSRLFSAQAQDAYTTFFSPPVPDFRITKIDIPSGVREYKLKPFGSASIALVVHGGVDAQTNSKQLRFTRGSVFFITAGESVTLAVHPDGVRLFCASGNV